MSADLYEQIIESAPNGVVLVDRDAKIVLINRETERMFGYERHELLGKRVETLVPTRFRDSHIQFRDTFITSPQSRAMGAGRDLFGLRKDGTELPIEIGLNPIETDQGPLILASVVDISRRKIAEDELKRSNEELGHFAYIASHDLQEPLRTVTSYVQLLERRYRDRLGSDAAEFIDFAVGAATRMQRLIEDLLAFSRIGTSQRAVEPLEAEAVLRVALEDLRAAITDSGAVITHEELPRVLGDAGQLEQVFTNLIGNALKFRGSEVPRVHVSARRKGPYWEFAVKDNGIGIDPKFFDRLFVIFQRLHARDTYPGTGIGLAISKKIVDGHGGRMWVTSTPGDGSTFHFTLLAPGGFMKWPTAPSRYS